MDSLTCRDGAEVQADQGSGSLQDRMPRGRADRETVLEVGRAPRDRCRLQPAHAVLHQGQGSS